MSPVRIRSPAPVPWSEATTPEPTDDGLVPLGGHPDVPPWASRGGLAIGPARRSGRPDWDAALPATRRAPVPPPGVPEYGPRSTEWVRGPVARPWAGRSPGSASRQAAAGPSVADGPRSLHHPVDAAVRATEVEPAEAFDTARPGDVVEQFDAGCFELRPGRDDVADDE